MPGVCARSWTAGRRQAAAPEERVDLAVLQRIRPTRRRRGPAARGRDRDRGRRRAGCGARSPRCRCPAIRSRRPCRADRRPLRCPRARERRRGACSSSRAPRALARRHRRARRTGRGPRPRRPACRPSVKAMSALPSRISLRLSTDAAVTSAVARTPGSDLVQDLREAAAVRVVDAAGAAGRDREEPRGRPRRCCRRTQRRTGKGPAARGQERSARCDSTRSVAAAPLQTR